MATATKPQAKPRRSSDCADDVLHNNHRRSDRNRSVSARLGTRVLNTHRRVVAAATVRFST